MAGGLLPDRASNLFLVHAVAFLTVWQGYEHRSGDTLTRPGAHAPLLTPLGTGTLMRLTGLVDDGLVAASPGSPPDAFTLHDHRVTRVDYERLAWRVCLPKPRAFAPNIEQVAASAHWPAVWHEEIGVLRFSLAWMEVMQYLRHCAGERGWLLEQTDGAVELVTKLLSTYSPAQCCTLIALAARATQQADYLHRPASADAAAWFLDDIERVASQLVAQGATVAAMPREAALPRSVMSHVLYDTFLPLGDRGFAERVDTRDVPYEHLDLLHEITVR